jgi:moderate conductance mechanosensitive channel
MQASNLVQNCYNIIFNSATSQANPLIPSSSATVLEPNSFTASLLRLETYERLLSHLIDFILKNAMKTVLIVALALILDFVIESVIRGICRVVKRRNPHNLTQHKKIDTIQSILLSVSRYVVAIGAVLKILTVWGVSAQSLTIGSAILAGAVGFGSQGLVQDMITGFGLLFEDQLQVGDYVQIGDKTGYVREVGLRVVKLESLDGTEHIIFNRQITTVSNLKPPQK